MNSNPLALFMNMFAQILTKHYDAERIIFYPGKKVENFFIFFSEAQVAPILSPI